MHDTGTLLNEYGGKYPFHFKEIIIGENIEGVKFFIVKNTRTIGYIPKDFLIPIVNELVELYGLSKKELENIYPINLNGFSTETAPFIILPEGTLDDPTYYYLALHELGHVALQKHALRKKNYDFTEMIAILTDAGKEPKEIEAITDLFFQTYNEYIVGRKIKEWIVKYSKIESKCRFVHQKKINGIISEWKSNNLDDYGGEIIGEEFTQFLSFIHLASEFIPFRKIKELGEFTKESNYKDEQFFLHFVCDWLKEQI